MSMLNCPCCGMQPGHYQISVEASLSPNLNRLDSFLFVYTYICLCVRGGYTYTFYFSFWRTFLYSDIWELYSDESSSANPCTACTFKWRGSPDRCMLGAFIPLWWSYWENPSCNWGWSLSPPCWASTVRITFYFLSFASIHFAYWTIFLHLIAFTSQMISLAHYIHSIIVYSHHSPSVLIPALRTVGNIVTGNDVQTQVFNTIFICLQWIWVFMKHMNISKYISFFLWQL